MEFVNSFMQKIFWNEEKGKNSAGPRRGQLHCALCWGEICPGEPYYRLDSQAVCEFCLERYARRYFARERRRAPGERSGTV